MFGCMYVYKFGQRLGNDDDLLHTLARVKPVSRSTFEQTNPSKPTQN